jgi:hypothetical protein
MTPEKVWTAFAQSGATRPVLMQLGRSLYRGFGGWNRSFAETSDAVKLLMAEAAGSSGGVFYEGLRAQRLSINQLKALGLGAERNVPWARLPAEMQIVIVRAVALARARQPGDIRPRIEKLRQGKLNEHERRRLAADARKAGLHKTAAAIEAAPTAAPTAAPAGQEPKPKQIPGIVYLATGAAVGILGRNVWKKKSK